MEYTKQFKNVDSYYSAIYDYCLDLVIKMLQCDKWYTDYSGETYNLDYKFIKVDSNYYIKFIGTNKKIKLPINDINDYFKFQNIYYIFNMVLKDLNISKMNKSNNSYCLVIKNKKLSSLISNLDYIKQAPKHYSNTNYKEDFVFDTLDFIINSKWNKVSNGFNISYKLLYDDENESVTIGIVDTSSETKRVLLYKRIYIDKETYTMFLKKLNEMISLFGIDLYSCNNINTLYVNDDNDAKRNFREYYSEGIKLKKLKF